MKKTTKRERRAEDGRILYDGPEHIPAFSSPEEEAHWISTHVPSDAYLATAVPMDVDRLLDLTRRAEANTPPGEPIRWPDDAPEQWKAASERRGGKRQAR
jgi:hypothetical protein